MDPINTKKSITTSSETQYKIVWDVVENNLVHQNMSMLFEDRDAANGAWVALKNNPNVCNIRTETVHNNKKYFAVEVIYFNYPKVYTFLSKQKVTAEYAVVGTNGVLQVVEVVKCYETTRREIEKKMSLTNTPTSWAL